MKIHPTIIAGAALAVMALVPVAPASAGGGVQLNFGGPLGTFTARPHGGGERYDHGPSRRAYKHHPAHKVAIADRKAAARRARIAEARELEAKRRQAAVEQKLAAKRKAAEIAKQKAVAAAKADEQSSKVAAAKRTGGKREILNKEVAMIEKVERAEQVEKVVNAVEIEKIETAALPEAAPVKAPTANATNVAIPVAAIENDSTSSEILLKTIDVETGGESGELADDQAREGLPAAADLDAPQTCKRFVPSAGLTITVPCSD